MIEPVAAALGASVVPVAELEAGDLPLRWEGEPVLGLRVPGLHGALERLLDAVEREEGVPLAALSREAKQRVVRQLDDAGAFRLRKAVEEVADALGVSRFTVYNYLNGARDESTGGERP